MKNKMIVLIKGDDIVFQIHDERSRHAANFTLELGKQTVENYYFAIPTMCGLHKFEVWEDSYIDSLRYFQRKFCKCFNGMMTIPEFIENMVKTFRIKQWQLNVNSNFDDSDLKKWSVDAIVIIAKAIENKGFSLQF